jgi:hypothetical protein
VFADVKLRKLDGWLGWIAVIGAKFPLIAVYAATHSAEKAVLTWCAVLTGCLAVKAFTGSIKLVKRLLGHTIPLS